MTGGRGRGRGASVRLRLALAHAAIFGALLVALAAAGLWAVERALRAQADAELADAARLLAEAVGTAPPAAAGGGDPAAARAAAVRSLRAGRLDVLVFDPAAGRVVSRVPARPPRPRGPARAAGPTGPAAVAGPGGRSGPRAPSDADPATDSAAWPGLLAAALAAGGGRDLAVFGLNEGAADARRVAALPVPGPQPGRLVLVALRDLDDVRAVAGRLRRGVAVAIPVALGCAVALGYLLARHSLAPVLAMSAQAARLAEGADAAPRARLVARDPDDELGRLAGAFNALLDRLAAALGQQRQFMADASHELRTPATVIRSAADVALRRADRSAAEYRQALELTRDEADRLARVVDDLFLLARADAGQPTLRLTEFDLDEALADCARAMRAVADTRGVAVRAELAAGDEGAPLVGDEALVRRLALNLLDNALKYTPAGGRVTLRLAPDELALDPADRAPHAHGPRRLRAAWRVEVEDTGPGVPPEARPRIFDRFFRSEAHAVRTPSGRSGAGLGLAMSRTIAEAHGGRLELSRSDATGSLFVAVLPRDGPLGGGSGPGSGSPADPAAFMARLELAG